MTDSQPKKINVAVVGGGMGGLCVAIGLLKHPHIHVEVYEAAHKFAEIGAGVAFGPNAQRALKLIGPETEQAYLKLATHNMWEELKDVWFEYRFGQGEREGELIAAPKNETGQSTVHRAKFLDEFVALVPKEICHFGKRLDLIKDNGAGQGVELHFKDGTVAKADCVLGADGIHSSVRKYLLGEDHPAVQPVFAKLAYRALVPMDKAVQAIGERYAQNAQIWLGKCGVIMTYPIDFGQTMNAAAFGMTEKWDGPQVSTPEPGQFKEEFSHFGETAKRIIELMDTPKTMRWAICDLPPAPSYYRGNVVMMGDAAHASTPFQGQGAGQAIEDAYVLESLFQYVDSPEKIPAAFEAFDKIRRPRAEHVVKTSRQAADVTTLSAPGVGEDVEALRADLEWRMDWMWHRDIEGERNEAVQHFEKLLAKK